MPTITARDFSSILNLNPFETAYECLKSKIIKKNFYGNKFTEHGNKYESYAIKMYENYTGNKVETQQLSCKHPKYEWITGRVDGVTILNKQPQKQKKRKLNANMDCIVEIKCPMKKPEAPLTHKTIPIYYWIQCQVYMNILNYDIAHYVEFYINPNDDQDKGEIFYLEIQRDKKWWKTTLPKIKKFYKEVLKYHENGNLENHPIRIEEKKWEKSFSV